jgi:hypothetical protein
VRQRGKETYKLKLTNKDFNYKSRLESGKQAVGPISAQTLVDWRLGECVTKFIGVCTEANRLKGAEAADFFFYCWYLKVLTDDRILHVISCKTLD